MEICNLIKNNIIPKKELNRVLTESISASAEIGIDFLCFEEEYEYVLEHTDKDDIIIDLGCAYNAQCWYFKDYDRYIAVDYPGLDDVYFDSGNVEFYMMSIQQFISHILPTLNLDLEKTVAICSAVPDKAAQDLVEKTFPRHYISYPGEVTRDTIGSLEMDRD